MTIRESDLILFQGDSITDAGRGGSPDGLGGGYVSMIPAILAAKYPERRYRIVNRGIGGDRTVELLARWKTDCLDLRPDVLSIMIGVNDVWRLRGEWNGQKFIAFPEFKANYIKLLDQAVTAGITRLFLVSPSAIENNKDEEISRHLDERAALVKELAVAYKAVYVPVRETQKRMLAEYSSVNWTSDGCHPSSAGHALLAQTWITAAGL
jgi:lysophospholipase L1-like esterase